MVVVVGAVVVAGAAAAGRRVGAQTAASPPVERQIAGAVLPLPEPQRAGATILGFGADGKMTTLRQGTNDFICLADNPTVPRFHASCYHKGLEPYMARGRELRAQGHQENAVDSIRVVELRNGRYVIPPYATLYQVFARAEDYDAATGAVKNPGALHVIYTPNATAESTGLSPRPVPGVPAAPWLMQGGTPVAHIMVSPPLPPPPSSTP
jgi:hypothetical protein